MFGGAVDRKVLRDAPLYGSGNDGLLMMTDCACGHVLARLQSGSRRRFRGPTPVTQTKLWLVVMVVTGIFWVILG